MSKPAGDNSQIGLPFGAAPAATPATPAEKPATAPAPERAEPEVLSVARLDRLIKRLLEDATTDVRVRGEVSNLHRAGSGHVYFCLKDEREDALIDCVMYRSAPAKARKQLADGERVVLSGRATMYPPRGRLQFIADDLLQSGRGALLEALELLKKKLAAEGLFAPERKKPLPAAPRTIAVLTSRNGAAIHDVTRVAFRRGRVRILLVSTPVQGAGAARRIAEAIAYTDRLQEVDAMIVTRGGGSAEDLSAYNDELVVRAIAAARIPIVSAVGHEIDVSLADLAADQRAATPSQAAELVVPDDSERINTLQHLKRRLWRASSHNMSTARERLTRLRGRLGEPRRLVLEQAQRFDELSARLERSYRRTLAARRQRLDAAQRKLEAQHPRRVLSAARLSLSPLGPKLIAAMNARVEAERHRLAQAAGRLDALSPLSVLGRGYAIATTTEGRVVARAGDVSSGDELHVRLHEGRIFAVVERTEEPDSRD